MELEHVKTTCACVLSNDMKKKYKKNYSLLYDFLLPPLYRLIFFKEFPKLIREAMRLIKNIGNRYLQEDYTYLIIYGVTASPHLLPKYVPNRLTLIDFSYQTIPQGFNSSLAKDARKNNFKPYNIYLGHYGLLNYRKERKEANVILDQYRFPKGHFGMHDPFVMVVKNNEMVSITYPYTQNQWDNEVPYETVVD